MDKKTINNKEVQAVVEFEYFLFDPYFTQGEHEGVFLLFAWSPKHEGYLQTSDIVNIHRINDIIYVETLNSVYQLDGTKKIQHLEDVERYLHDEKYTSKEFYDKCVANMMITKDGWRVF